MRLQCVIERANMTANAFAKHLGLPRGECLYQIKRGNYGISRRLAARIVEKYPDINELWLLTGEGDMLRGSDCGSIMVPFYDADISQAATLDELVAVSEIVVPHIAPCDFGMRNDAGHEVVLVRCLREQDDDRAEGEYLIVANGAAAIIRGAGADDARCLGRVVGRIAVG